MEEQLKKQSLSTANAVKVVFVIFAIVLLFLGILNAMALSGKIIQDKVTIMDYSITIGLFMIAIILVIMGNYLYCLLATQAYMVYNSKRIVDGVDYLEVKMSKAFPNTLESNNSNFVNASADERNYLYNNQTYMERGK